MFSPRRNFSRFCLTVLAYAANSVEGFTKTSFRCESSRVDVVEGEVEGGVGGDIGGGEDGRWSATEGKAEPNKGGGCTEDKLESAMLVSAMPELTA